MSTEQITIRPYADVDRDHVIGLDTSLRSDSICRVSRVDDSFLITTEPREPSRLKTYDLADELTDAAWDQAWVAEGPNGITAFCATRFERWNRRQVLMDLFVDAGWRRRGLGRMLLDRVWARALENGANHVLLETSNANVSAVRWYERMGFVLCGLDVNFYRGTANEGEVGLFMSQDIPGQ